MCAGIMRTGEFLLQQLESVKDLQYYCVRLDFNHIYFKRKLTFLHALCDLDLVIRTCFSMFKRTQEFWNLSIDFNCIIDVFSVVELKICVFSAFSKVALRVS